MHLVSSYVNLTTILVLSISLLHLPFANAIENYVDNRTYSDPVLLTRCRHRFRHTLRFAIILTPFRPRRSRQLLSCIRTCFNNARPSCTKNYWTMRRMRARYSWCCSNRCGAVSGRVVTVDGNKRRRRYFDGCSLKIVRPREMVTVTVTPSMSPVASVGGGGGNTSVVPSVSASVTASASISAISSASASVSVTPTTETVILPSMLSSPSELPLPSPSMSASTSMSSAPSPSPSNSPSQSIISSSSVSPSQSLFPSPSQSSSQSTTPTKPPSYSPSTSPIPSLSSTPTPLTIFSTSTSPSTTTAPTESTIPTASTTPLTTTSPSQIPEPSTDFFPGQSIQFNAEVLRNNLDEIFSNTSDPLLREVKEIDIRVVLDDSVITLNEFEMSEPYAEQLTLKELALGEEEFFRRRREDKKRMAEESGRRRRNNREDSNSITSTSSGSASANTSASGNGTANSNASANESSSTTSSRMKVIRSLTVTDCLANRCGTKVTIWSPEYVRWKIINRAFDVLRAKPGFNSVYNTDKANIVVRHVNGKRYAVLVPFSERYTQEF